MNIVRLKIKCWNKKKNGKKLSIISSNKKVKLCVWTKKSKSRLKKRMIWLSRMSLLGISERSWVRKLRARKKPLTNWTIKFLTFIRSRPASRRRFVRLRSSLNILWQIRERSANEMIEILMLAALLCSDYYLTVFNKILLWITFHRFYSSDETKNFLY